MSDFIYDLESYPNVFTLSAREVGSVNRYKFEISHRKDDRPQLIQFIQWLRDTRARMVGFNNVGFDYPVLHFILTSDPTVRQIYDFVMTIIDGDHSRRFDHVIWDRDQIVPQVDLYKIHHFDNVAKATSLKVLEFNMRLSNIKDLPFPPGTILTDQQIDKLIIYNDDDVDATEEFYVHSLPMIRFREELSAKYDRNFLNHNDTKIGKDYFIMELERIAPGSCYEIGDGGKRKIRQTWRNEIALKDIIFPWIKFKRPEFIAVLDWFKGQILTRQQVEETLSDTVQTKGFFTKIPRERLGAVAQYAHFQKNNTVKNLNVVVNGFQFDFGTGGLHGSVSSQIVRGDTENELLDVDVTSYYPSIPIVNRIYPAHLGEAFCDVYSDLKTQRVGYAKGTTENGMLKLALNGTFGDTNNKYSVFYDPQYCMSVTINGQLMLCLLADYLLDVPGLQIIQVNTDGVTIRYPREQVASLRAVLDWWQAHTCLDLEEAVYSRFFVANVNNYIAEYEESGKLKRKGAYEYKMQWHQNHSALVIPMAAEAALIEGIPVRDFILNHDNLHDFMLRAKVPRSSRLILRQGPIDTQLQNISRYYISKSGGSLVKVMPPLPKNPDKWREIGIDVGWTVRECNDINQADGLDINMEYYIKEAEKLVLPLTGGQP